MLKTDLQNLIAGKKGFIEILSDNVAEDNVNTDAVTKRYFRVRHSNTDGTEGITRVYYLEKDKNNVSFYNVEPDVFDANELTDDAKKQAALEAYLGGKYNAYFINRVDFVKNWAEAVVYTLTAGSLTKKTVLVFKQGNNPINDLDVV